jgi:FkbM family methyltransferase
MKEIYNNKFIRPLVMKILKKMDFDIFIKHHWTGVKVKLHLFKHKGYWYHGKKRENTTMQLFNSLIHVGDNIVEAGGHIGYISLFFSKLVGNQGRVIVFEPGVNNLPYIRRNIKEANNIILFEKAIGDFIGEVDFFEDDLTGQNNSIVENFKGFEENAAASYVGSQVKRTRVHMVTLDSEIKSSVDFIKIDIEAGECKALLGSKKMLEEQKPILMVEIQADEEVIYNFFNELGYSLFTPEITKVINYSQLSGNVFCLHTVKHKKQIKKYFTND